MGLRMGSLALVVSGLALALSTGSAQAAAQHSVSPKAAHAATSAVPAGSLFTPISPLRVLDTRDGTGLGGAAAPLGPFAMIYADLSGKVPTSATAIVLNLTGTSPSTTTYISVQADPTAGGRISNLNLVAGETRANAVTVPVGPDSRVSFTNFAGTVNLVADLAGYYTPGSGSGFTSESPIRVLDTRAGTGTSGVVAPVGANGVITLDLSRVVPARAAAVTLNLTGVDATSSTYITAWPDGAPRPLASSLNLVAGEVVPNLVTVALSADDKIDLYNFAGSTDLLADVSGYYSTGTGNPFYQLNPARALDTRNADGTSVAPIGAGKSINVDLSPWLPSSATAAVFNLTGTNTTESTFVTAWPAGATQPLASNLNLTAGQTAANLATVGLGSGDQLAIGNFQGNVDVLVDVAGYFAAPPAPCTSNCVPTSGGNEYGRLGNGTATYESMTVAQVPGLSGVSSIAAGYGQTYALDTNGTVYAWGRNEFQELGNGKTVGADPVPAPVVGLPKITAIAADDSNGYALDVNHHMWAWGYNETGGLGDGNTDVSAVPVQVDLPGPVTAIASGDTSAYAVLADGTVWSWGNDQFDTLGNGNSCAYPHSGLCFVATPAQMPIVSNVVAVYATGSDGYAVESDGSVWAWGWNAGGGLAIGTVGGIGCYDDAHGANCEAASPIEVPALAGVTKIAGTYAIKPDGTVLAWGSNYGMPIGNGTHPTGDCNANPSGANCYFPTPFVLAGLSGVTDIGEGAGYAVAVKSDGTVFGWGDSVTRDGGSQVPVQLSVPQAVSTVAAGWYHVAFTVKTP